MFFQIRTQDGRGLVMVDQIVDLRPTRSRRSSHEETVHRARRRRYWRWVGGAAPAVRADHAPTAGFCTGETLISHTLKNGAKWEMCWGTHSLKGLVLSKVAFQGPKDTAPKLVIDAINTAQMNVPYDNGNIEYDDVLQYGFGGQYLRGLDVTECPKGELRNATVSWETSTSVYREEVRPVLCIREDDTGTAYRSQYRSNNQILAKQGTDLIVSATAAIGNYEYEMRYSFHDDGQIDADLGATGEAIPFGSSYVDGWPVGNGQADFLMNHYHSAVWRVDFNLDGQSQMKAEQWDTAPSGQRGTQSAIYNTTKTDIPTEKMLNLDNRRWFRVVAPNSLNPDGHARSTSSSTARTTRTRRIRTSSTSSASRSTARASSSRCAT